MILYNNKNKRTATNNNNKRRNTLQASKEQNKNKDNALNYYRLQIIRSLDKQLHAVSLNEL